MMVMKDVKPIYMYCYSLAERNKTSTKYFPDIKLACTPKPLSRDPRYKVKFVKSACNLNVYDK